MFLLLIALFIFSLIPFFLIIIFIITRKRSEKIFERQLKDIKEKSAYRKTKNNIQAKNDFLFLEKIDEKDISKEESQGVVQKIETYQQLQKREQKKIVGIAKPKGFWSKFIMSQQIGFILAKFTANKNKEQGFWVNLIKAQSASQGKYKGRRR